MRPLLRALAAIGLLAAFVLPAAAEPGLRGALDLRLRQEYLDGLYYWSPDQPDRNWLRLRSRAGAAYSWGASHEIEARACSEFRKITTPDTPLNYDEIILDRLLYRHRPSDWATLTLGRQDIAWDDGFLVMDGTPLDGSRSAYLNALRLELTAEDPDLSLLEGFFAHNPATDDLVLWDDDIERRLTDADETAAALRARFARQHQLALIWKRERDPDHARPALDAWTLGYRIERTRGAVNVMGEVAIQYQDWSAPAKTSGLAWAMQTRLRRPLRDEIRMDLGVYAYSGRIGDQLAFRTPWGRWPKWSELMLYRLIGEGGVGAWANLAGPWIELERRKGAVLFGFGAQIILAPEPRWEVRDMLLRLCLERALAAGLSTQLLLEQMLGTGYDSVDYQPAFGSCCVRPIDAGGGAFLRWQLTYETN
ncbi:hypothetical protein FJ251_09785 [bacterium]|nr:hypothetical protein [bacterium]